MIFVCHGFWVWSDLTCFVTFKVLCSLEFIPADSLQSHVYSLLFINSSAMAQYNQEIRLRFEKRLILSHVIGIPFEHVHWFSIQTRLMVRTVHPSRISFELEIWNQKSPRFEQKVVNYCWMTFTISTFFLQTERRIRHYLRSSARKPHEQSKSF